MDEIVDNKTGWQHSPRRYRKEPLYYADLLKLLLRQMIGGGFALVEFSHIKKKMSYIWSGRKLEEFAKLDKVVVGVSECSISECHVM